MNLKKIFLCSHFLLNMNYTEIYIYTIPMYCLNYMCSMGPHDCIACYYCHYCITQYMYHQKSRTRGHMPKGQMVSVSSLVNRSWTVAATSGTTGHTCWPGSVQAWHCCHSVYSWGRLSVCKQSSARNKTSRCSI